MIELSLKNFQSHKETALQFDKGVNVIVGVSDSGKSAILRALRWLWTSRPLGDYFVHWGEKDCSAKLKINGNEIIRGKEKKQNYYSVNGKVLEAMKAEVPAEVSQALQLEDINWQGQRDLDFLLSLSPLEASKYIQKLCGLEAVLPILATLASMELENKKKAKDVEEQKENVSIKLKAFEGFPIVAQKEQELAELLEQKEKLEAAIFKLSEEIQNMKVCGTKLRIGAQIPKMYQLTEEIKKQSLFLEYNKPRIAQLENLCIDFGMVLSKKEKFANIGNMAVVANKLGDLLRIRQQLQPIAHLEAVVASCKALAGLAKANPLMPEINLVIDRLRVAKEARLGLEAKDKEITNIISMIVWVRQDLRKNMADLEQAKKELPKVCPVCGKELEDKR